MSLHVILGSEVHQTIQRFYSALVPLLSSYLATLRDCDMNDSCSHEPGRDWNMSCPLDVPGQRKI